jgi:hypothetical protein
LVCIDRSKAHLKRESSKILKFAPLIKKYGLKKEHVDLIFDVIISFELASVQTREVIDILLPRENVPENHIVQIIGKFSIKGADTKVIVSSKINKANKAYVLLTFFYGSRILC